MDIAIDFDGTCVTHEYPEVGKDIGAAEILKELVKAGHRLILFTMRSDSAERLYLTEATKWFKDNKIPLYGVQTNPTQLYWTTSPKAYAQLYIDDAGLGCPLIHPSGGRSFVDWKLVRLMLSSKGILNFRNI